jgi:putative ABC transport system permease protein
VVASLPIKATGLDANVQVRGVGQRALDVHDGVKIAEGRFVTPGMTELVVGKNARKTYAGLDPGQKLKFGGVTWTWWASSTPAAARSTRRSGAIRTC